MTNNPATDNHGPLTTIFTPPASCASTTIKDLTSGRLEIFQALSGVPPPGGDAKYSTFKQCYPTTTKNSLNIDNWASFYYSPGICPTGWPAACQLTQFPAGSVDRPSVFPTQTMGVVCCPTGWSCVTCGAAVPTSGSASESSIVACLPAGCQRRFTEGEVVSGFGMSANKEITVTISRRTFNFMTGVPVLWESSDTDIVSLLSRGTDSLAKSVNARGGGDAKPEGRTTGGSPTQVSTDPTGGRDTNMSSQTHRPSLQNLGHPTILNTFPAGNTDTGGPANRSSSNVAHNGLSPAAKISLAVALPVCIIAFLIGIFFCLHRRASASHGKEISDRNSELRYIGGRVTPSIHELPASDIMTKEEEDRSQWEKHELDSGDTREGRRTLFALVSRWGRHELDSKEKRSSKDVGEIEGVPVVERSKTYNSNPGRLSSPFFVDVVR